MSLGCAALLACAAIAVAAEQCKRSVEICVVGAGPGGAFPAEAAAISLSQRPLPSPSIECVITSNQSPYAICLSEKKSSLACQSPTHACCYGAVESRSTVNIRRCRRCFDCPERGLLPVTPPTAAQPCNCSGQASKSRSCSGTAARSFNFSSERAAQVSFSRSSRDTGSLYR